MTTMLPVGSLQQKEGKKNYTSVSEYVYTHPKILIPTNRFLNNLEIRHTVLYYRVMANKKSLSGKTQGIWKCCQNTGKTQGILSTHREFC